MENLWKKEIESALYVDLFNAPNAPERTPVILKPTPAKSNVIAAEFRTSGYEFDTFTWTMAIEDYNKSLCYTELGSESMALTYATRAARYLSVNEYDKCLADIELAMVSNGSRRLMQDLKRFKSSCLVKQATSWPIYHPKLKLSYPPNANILSMANVLEIRHNVEFGRHVVAKNDIPAGKTILIESPFVSTASDPDDHICWTCQRDECRLIPCEKCTVAMFCSAECLERGRGFHSMECGYDVNDAGHDRTSTYLARTIFIALSVCNDSVEELMAFVDDTRNELSGYSTSTVEPKDAYRSFLMLKADTQDNSRFHKTLKSAVDTYCYMLAIPKMAQLVNTLPKQRFLMHLTTMHATILFSNGCNTTMGGEGGKFASFAMALSLFNHRCASNVYAHKFNDGYACFTVRPIQQGEQLFISYAPRSPPTRRQHFFDKFGFWCVAYKCVPVKLPAHLERRMENDKNYKAIQELGPLDGYFCNYIVQKKAKKHCIQFLNAFGRLPSNKQLESIVSLFKDIIRTEYDVSEY